MDFLLWIDSILYPEDTFNAESDKASLKEAAKHGVISGFLYGGITGLLLELFPAIHTIDPTVTTIKAISGNYFIIANIFFFTIFILALLFLISGVLYFATHLLKKGYGDFRTQTYLISFLFSGIVMLSIIRFVIPIIGELLFLLILLYSTKPLIIAMKRAHQFGTNDAVSTIALSFGSLAVIFMILFAVFWNMGIILPFGTKSSIEGFKNLRIIGNVIKYNDSAGSLEFKVVNTLDEPIILTDVIAEGDCVEGYHDFNSETKKKEYFITLAPNEQTRIKIENCTKKGFVKKFFVPLNFQYRNKKVGEGITHTDVGVITGAIE